MESLLTAIDFHHCLEISTTYSYRTLIAHLAVLSEDRDGSGNDAIDIQRRGGAVRLPSGKVLTRGADWESMPRIGTRYLLFLKYDQSTEDYSILMGYELAGNEVYRLDELNENDANYSQIAHLLRAEGPNESKTESAPEAPGTAAALWRLGTTGWKLSRLVRETWTSGLSDE